MYRLFIPCEPKGKGRPRFTRMGVAYTPTTTREYEELLQREMRKQFTVPIDVPCEIDITFIMPIPMSWSKSKRAAAYAGNVPHEVKPDIDNLVKACLDSANGVLITDDKLVTRLTAEKRYGEPAGIRIRLGASGNA